MKTKTPKPERWAIRAGEAAVARLDIPADARRERRFEIACWMSVRAVEGADAPWHELRVLADGELQWQRRITTQHPAASDGLDYRFQRLVPLGRTLRLQALVECSQVLRLQLQIEAEEV
jgi:hypothetical protein